MLTHFNNKGEAVMVDISHKDKTLRKAVAKGEITLNDEAVNAVKNGSNKKGDTLSAARIAGIMAAKKTYELIPLCHIIPITHLKIDFEIKNNTIECICSVSSRAETGVEMEALTGVSAALLTIYDMCKAADKSMIISNICLLEKTGGKSGDYRRK